MLVLVKKLLILKLLDIKRSTPEFGPKTNEENTKHKADLISHNYDRENIVRSMLGIDTACSVEPCISVLSLLKVVLQLWHNVLLVHPDELVAIMPHWC